MLSLPCFIPALYYLFSFRFKKPSLPSTKVWVQLLGYDLLNIGFTAALLWPEHLSWRPDRWSSDFIKYIVIVAVDSIVFMVGKSVYTWFFYIENIKDFSKFYTFSGTLLEQDYYLEREITSLKRQADDIFPWIREHCDLLTESKNFLSDNKASINSFITDNTPRSDTNNINMVASNTPRSDTSNIVPSDNSLFLKHSDNLQKIFEEIETYSTFYDFLKKGNEETKNIPNEHHPLDIYINAITHPSDQINQLEELKNLGLALDFFVEFS